MAARKNKTETAKIPNSRKKVISKNVKEKVKIVAKKKKKGGVTGVEPPSVPVIAASKGGSKKKGGSLPVNQGIESSSGVTVKDAGGLPGGRGRGGSSKRGSGGRGGSSGMSSNRGAGSAGGRGRGGSSNRGAGKASGRGKRNSNKSSSPPPTDTSMPSPPEFLDIPVITNSKEESKNKDVSRPVSRGRGGSSGMSSNRGAGPAGGRGRGSSRGGSSNRGTGKASGGGKRNSNKSFSPPPTDTGVSSQPEFPGIPVIANSKGGSKKNGVSLPVKRGRGGSSGVSRNRGAGLAGGRGSGSSRGGLSNRGAGLAGGRGRKSSRGGLSNRGAGLAGGRGRGRSSNRGAGKASGRGKRNSNKSFSPPPTDTGMPYFPSGIPVITDSKVGSKKKGASLLPVNGGQGGSSGVSSNRGTGLEHSIKENQINLETIEDNKLIQKGEKIIKLNQMSAPENMDEFIAVNPPEQTVHGNLLEGNNDMTVAMLDEKASDALKSSENWALVKSTIMKNHDTDELNKSLYKWNKTLFKDNLELSSIVQLGYEDQRKLRYENTKLKSSLAACEEKIQKFEQMNKSLWQQLDQKTLESEVRYNSKNQQFLLRKNFKDLTEKVKSECDEKCKKLERELISVTKENDHLNKRLEKITDSGHKQIPKKVQTKNTFVPVIDVGNDSKGLSLMPAHQKTLVSVSDVIGETEILMGKSNKVEEIYIQSDSDNDCMIVGEDAPKRQPEIEKVLLQGEPKPNVPVCEIELSSEEDLEMPSWKRTIEVSGADTSDDSNDEICKRSETSISIEGNITTTEDELEKKEMLGLGESFYNKIQSEPAEDKNLQYPALVKQEVKVEDRAHSHFPTQVKREITSTNNEKQDESETSFLLKPEFTVSAGHHENKDLHVQSKEATVHTEDQLPSHVPVKKVPLNWSIVPETCPVRIGTTLGPSSHQSVRARLAANPTEIVPVHQAAPCQKLKIEQKILENANKRNQLSAIQPCKPGRVRNLSSSSSSASSEADDEEMSSQPSDAKPVAEDIKRDKKPDGRNIKPDPEAGMYVHQTKQRISRVQDVSPAYAKNLKLVTARTSEQLKGKTIITFQPLGSQPKVEAKPKTKAKTRRMSKHYTPPSKRIKTEIPISENTNTAETQIVPANDSLETQTVPFTTLPQNQTESWVMMQQMYQQMMVMQKTMMAITQGNMPGMQMMNRTDPSAFTDIGGVSTANILPSDPTNISNMSTPLLNAETCGTNLPVPNSTSDILTAANLSSMNVSPTANDTRTLENVGAVNNIGTSGSFGAGNNTGISGNVDTVNSSGTSGSIDAVNNTVPHPSKDPSGSGNVINTDDPYILNAPEEVESEMDCSVPVKVPTSEKIESMPAMSVESNNSSGSSVDTDDNPPSGTLASDLLLSDDSSDEEELSFPSSPTPETFDLTSPLSPPLNKWTQGTQSNDVGLSVIFLNKLVGKSKLELDGYLNGTTRCLELNCPSDLPPDTGLARAAYQFVFSDRENMEKESSERDLPLSHAAQKALTVIQILAKTDKYRNLPSLALDYFDTQIVSANSQYDAFQIGGPDIHSNLVKLGRFYGALSRQFNLKEEIKTIVFNALYWRPPHAFSLTYGILCLNSDIFSGLPYEKFGLTERAIIYALAYPPKFNDAKHCRPVQSLLKQSLCLVIPELTYEQFVDSMLEEMKGLEEDNILKKATRAMSMLCLQMNLKCFEQFMTTRIGQWVVDWQHSKITDAVLACFINVIGTVGYDSPKHGDISGLQTLVATLKRVNEDIMDQILKDAIQCSYSKIENKIKKMQNTKERTLRYETNNTGRIKKKSKKKKNKRFNRKNRPIMDKRQREMVKAAEELFSP